MKAKVSRFSDMILRMGAVGLLCINPTYSQSIETDDYVISLIPMTPSNFDVIGLQFQKKESAACGLVFKGTRIDVDNRVAELAALPARNQFTGCPEPTSVSFLLGPTYKEGEWSVRVYETSELDPMPLFSPVTEIAQLVANLSEPAGAISGANAEVPTEGSLQSGVGIVRGWALRSATYTYTVR